MIELPTPQVWTTVPPAPAILKVTSPLPALIVRVFPPSTINGCVNNSLLWLATSAADCITTILLFVTVGVGVPADLTIIDLITYVSLTKG